MTSELCSRGRIPHHGPHDARTGNLEYTCPGWPHPDSPAGHAADIIYEEISAALHGDTSGLDDGVATAVRHLVDDGLISDSDHDE